MSTLALNGTRKSGDEVRNENMTAAIAIANIVKNSLGPAGLDKMIVDDMGELFITNDGATILKKIEVKHPAAKILVELANLQDKEIGDGTTSVVLIAAELVRRGNELIRNSIHPTTVIAGFQQAKKEACKFIAENLTYRISDLPEDCLEKAASTAMSSKVIGAAKEHFSALAVRALKGVARPTVRVGSKGTKGVKMAYDIANVKLLKLRGNSLKESYLVEGLAFERSRSFASFGMPSSVKNAKMAFIDFDLRKEKLPFNVKVVANDPAQIEAVRAQETAVIERRIALLLDAGATLVLSSRSIDDFAMHAIAARGAAALKNVPRKDLQRLAAATGGRLLTSLAALDGKDCAEKVEADALGVAEEVCEEQVGDVARIAIVKTKGADSKAKGVGGLRTLVLRGPNEFALEEVERSMHDVLCALKRVLESNRVVVGGGVVESALSIYLENFAETVGSREQLAIAEFASSLLVIPKTLAANGALDSTELVAQLRAAQNGALEGGRKEMKSVGLSLQSGRLRDNLKAGVFEPAMGKIKSIKFATEAAVTILRIDDCVIANPKPAPSRPGRRPY